MSFLGLWQETWFYTGLWMYWFTVKYSVSKVLFSLCSYGPANTVDFMSFNLSGRPWQAFPSKTVILLLSRPFSKIKANIMSVSWFLKLFIGNQIDWVLLLVCGCQVLCEDLNFNTVFKLLILVWSYEGMKVLDLGYEKSWEKFSISAICDIISSFS